MKYLSFLFLLFFSLTDSFASRQNIPGTDWTDGPVRTITPLEFSSTLRVEVYSRFEGEKKWRSKELSCVYAGENPYGEFIALTSAHGFDDIIGAKKKYELGIQVFYGKDSYAVTNVRVNPTYSKTFQQKDISPALKKFFDIAILKLQKPIKGLKPAILDFDTFKNSTDLSSPTLFNERGFLASGYCSDTFHLTSVGFQEETCKTISKLFYPVFETTSSTTKKFYLAFQGKGTGIIRSFYSHKFVDWDPKGEYKLEWRSAKFQEGILYSGMSGGGCYIKCGKQYKVIGLNQGWFRRHSKKSPLDDSVITPLYHLQNFIREPVDVSLTRRVLLLGSKFLGWVKGR